MTSKKMQWTGYIVTALPVLLLLFSGVMKLIKPASVMEGFAHLGYPESLVVGIGIVELTSVMLYVIPQTAVLGAILLTAYLGGATATHLRIGEPVFMPILLGVLVWGGLYIREVRLRMLVPANVTGYRRSSWVCRFLATRSTKCQRDCTQTTISREERSCGL